MNVILFMCGHDCRVNAVSPCHIGAGGLIVHFEEKRPVYKPPVQCATSSNPSIYIYDTVPLIATRCLFQKRERKIEITSS